MPTVVKLQPTFSYGLVPLWVLFIVLISPLLLSMREKRKEKRAMREQNILRPAKQAVPPSVKRSYVNKLTWLGKEYKDGERDSRDCYQLLSVYIREFVKEYAGIDVTKKTLAEIRGQKLPELEKLIEEYYACEFAPDVSGNIELSIERTKMVINSW